MLVSLLTSALLVSGSSGEMVPSPAVVVLRDTSPLGYTRWLLAQAASDAERAREEGAEAPVEPLPEPSAADEIAAPGDHAQRQETLPEPGAADDGAAPGDHPHAEHEHEHGHEAPARRHGELPVGPDSGAGEAHEQSPTGLRLEPTEGLYRYAPPTRDDHGRAYYLAWGLVDWGLAGGLWATSIYSTVTALQFWGLATKDGKLDQAEQYPYWIDPESGGMRKRNYRTGAIVTGCIAVALAAAGGVFAWRAIPNIQTYGDLKRQETIERRAFLGLDDDPRWTGPPGPEAPGGQPRSRLGTSDRYDARDGATQPETAGPEPGLAPAPGPEPAPAPTAAPERPQSEYRSGDPEWAAYLEAIRRRAADLEQEAPAPGDTNVPGAAGPEGGAEPDVTEPPEQTPPR